MCKNGEELVLPTLVELYKICLCKELCYAKHIFPYVQAAIRIEPNSLLETKAKIIEVKI